MVIQVKDHLKDIYRVDLDNISRFGYLRLDKNESVGGLPEEFIKEVISEIDSEMLSTYPEYGIVKHRIAEHVGLKPENISLFNGSDDAIKNIFETYISPSDKILVTDPTFAMYPIYSKIFNSETLMVQYDSIDIFPKKQFLSKIKSKIKLVVIINPNNPTGSAVDMSYIKKVLLKAKEHDSIVIVDEAYHYFYPETAIRLVNKYDNLIVLRSFSKLFAMASVRIGYAVADKSIIEDLRKVKPTYEVNSIGVLFAKKILERKDLIARLIQEEKKGKQYLADKLKKEKIEYKIGKPNFVLIKCEDRVGEIIEKLEKEKILVAGKFKQSYLKEYIRVTTGKKEYMDQFWKEFVKIWRRT